MERKGFCQRVRRFYGLVTITEKGQLAIPIELRRELGLDKGGQLLVIKRQDGQGINLIRAEAVEGFLKKAAKG